MICGVCGKENNGKRVISGIPMCEGCFEKLTKLRNGDYETIKYFRNRDNMKYATGNALVYINEIMEKKIQELDLNNRLLEDAATNNPLPLKVNTDLYEYDVVTILNKEHGLIDKEKMSRILQLHAIDGWRLHTIYSNELGKNAIMLLGLGVNSTACEDVLIFERKIRNEENN